jgi:putative FmdB family regulatory protein
MPLYDYECPHCDTKKEVQHAVNEIGKIEVLCDECMKPMKKLLSVPALIGFDSVGRSLSKKERTETPDKSSNKEASNPETPKKETTAKTGTKKDAAA